ncbi:MAG: FAD-dependent oxidoreductase [Gammaproteobacteria bacterium]|nr:FAD-dependent oxidoreductase [Gammaproteobacteria bacterium]
MHKTPTLTLKNFTYQELFEPQSLKRLDDHFLAILPSEWYEQLLKYRENQHDFSSLAVSELLIILARYLEKFLIELFQIEDAAALAQAQTLAQNPVSAFKQYFVLRRAKKLLQNIDALPSFQILNEWLNQILYTSPLQTDDSELAIALFANQCIQEPERFADETEKLTQWCARALTSAEGQALVNGWASFHIPERIDHQHLIKHEILTKNDLPYIVAPEDHLRQRDGFTLTDPRMDARHAQDEVNYCIYCHDHEGDFCSKGFPVKKTDFSLGFRQNPLDVTLTGCPLEEKISEMHLLKRDGHTIAALAMIMVDNPMCPATGHRICNDCMKACIYQKQEPVNIPQAETRALTDVLHLPWGVEIYDLLTRWNPLRQKQYLLKPYNGLKIMIAGQGPAGFTLAHHMLLEGFAVVGFDGLKIEPLPESLIRNPIYCYDDITEPLNKRQVTGFGGVAEYGITVRWDKNFLKLIYLSLLRKKHYQVFGGARFGGTVTVDDAFAMGFDHFAIAVGAGLPKALSIPNSLLPGMRQANDFLMALQLGNASHPDSLTNLQVRLPAVVIGGGLTGVDTATEVQAYYICQVEKILHRYESLTQKMGAEKILAELDIASIDILNEFIAHGKRVREERQRAALLKQQPDFISLIREWGGVTIVYRRSMQDSPAYINNHEELQKALEEGIYYLEALEPVEAERDTHGHAAALLCEKRIKNTEGDWKTTDERVRLPARSIFVATGTKPNIAYEFEHRGTFARDGFSYQHYEDKDNQLRVSSGILHCKATDFGPFTSYQKNDKRVSLIGDTHPVFHGSVVKAIASGMRAWPKIVDTLKNKISETADLDEYQQFADHMRYLFSAEVKSVSEVAPGITELVIQAPIAAQKFRPGQFFRLQNFETQARTIHHTQLQIEPLALTASDVNRQAGTLKFMVLEKGASTKLCKQLKMGEPVSLMGPTGIHAKIADKHETVLIVGNILSLAITQSYASALKQAGNKVIYLGLFNDPAELYCQKHIEEITDLAIWVTPDRPAIQTNRPQDYSVNGDPIEVLQKYARGALDPLKTQPEIPLSDIDRIYLIGNSCLLKQFQHARKHHLKTMLTKNPRVQASVYSTMQCMLKGVCAQCLQWQIDPETGKRTKAVFACSWPEQPLELVDIDNIDERQMQNRLQEKLSELWVTHL